MTTCDQQIEKGNALFVDEDFSGALLCFSSALSLNPADLQAHARRAACLEKLGRGEEAAGDWAEAVRRCPDNARWQKRCGMAHFALEKYARALEAFTQAGQDDDDVQLWIRKCRAELGDGLARSEPASKPASSEQPAPPAPAIRHSWYQSPDAVVVDIFAKNVQKCDVDYQPLSLSVEVDGQRMTINPLFGPIVPADCAHRVTPAKVEIRLKKADFRSWAKLEAPASLAPLFSTAATPSAVPVPLPEFTHSYPTSSRNKVNWDAVDKDIEKELSQEKPTGEDALNHLLRNIYKDASDETRRAMQKSMIESGGTVLSTNWADVGSRKVEGSAPKGMEMRKFEM
jgi:suppressor of G2 allele of SKP1